jgi:hypothetical protein
MVRQPTFILRLVHLHAGDTPKGDYVSSGITSTTGWNQNSCGPWWAIRLKAVAGDALLAQDVFGRKGLLIHGGLPGALCGLDISRIIRAVLIGQYRTTSLPPTEANGQPVSRSNVELWSQIVEPGATRGLLVAFSELEL